MNRKITSFVLILLIFVSFISLCLLGKARGTDDFSCSITSIDSNNFPVIKSYVSFTDASGETIKGLGKEVFTVIEDEKEIKNFSVQSLKENEGDFSVTVLAVDCSKSMEENNALDAAKKGALEFIKMMDSNDQCTVISISRNITNKVSAVASGVVFTSDKTILTNSINSIVPEPFTKLYDGLYEALACLQNVSSLRKNVILLTDADSRDEESVHTIDECITLAKSLGVTIYAIGEGKTVNEEPLKKLSSETNGLYFSSPEPQNLLDLYQKISKNIHNQYVISYKSLISSKDAPSKHNLTVKVQYKNQTYSASKAFIPVIIPSKNSWLGIIIIGAAFLAALIVSLILLPRRNKKKCVNCGRLIRKELNVCPFCGYSYLPKVEKEAPQPTVFAAQEVEVQDKTRIVKRGMSLAWVTVVDGKEKGKSFDVKADEPTSIGRDGSNSIILEDDSVSRKHAKISKSGDKYLIHDLASVNGTYVNKKRVDVAEIKDGDILYIGDVTLAFKKIKKGEKK